MSVVAVAHHYHLLPDTPYALWVRGELAEQLDLPNDGTRVEVVGGEIAVSPGPSLDHNFIVKAIDRAMYKAETVDPNFRWESVHTSDLNLVAVQDGYIPGLNILEKQTALDLWERKAKHLLPHEVEAVVEVTSRGNAANDRPPRIVRPVASKWSGYARAGIPFYLLVDRDPRTPGVTLYGEPDVHSGVYQPLHNWKFGDTIQLPEPLSFEIPTERWTPWDE
ncbi:Uma2 family endonuclease [Actinomadura fibrosa]|uniref:Uma2 family endonuclease n=1 Tax=Actinomadura fibrosa TaxID=111802 RepID=A0ABW2XH18_9ACTN|nr:Uma2 family endonuclease [Actinomadura fibrosa]